MKRTSFPHVLLILLAAASTSLYAQQHARTANLTEAEVDQVRESAVYPEERVKLYTRSS